MVAQEFPARRREAKIKKIKFIITLLDRGKAVGPFENAEDVLAFCDSNPEEPLQVWMLHKPENDDADS